MHSIIKNLSKVLALTTTVSSFAILPGAKVSGVRPENIPPSNGRSETQVPTAEMINTAIAELSRLLGGDHVVECSNEFLRDRELAYKILQELISRFAVPLPHLFPAEYNEKFIKSGKKLHLKSLSEASDTLVLSFFVRRPVNASVSITIGDTITCDVTAQDITPNAITMFFGCGRDHVDRLCMYTRNCFLEFFANSTRQLAIGIVRGRECWYRYSNLVK